MNNPHKINRIFIACYKGDVRLTRACVASIRHWYPDIRISLIKDCSQGDFPTRDLCRRWHVDEFVTGRTHYGWGLSKLEPLFLPARERCFIMDSDIIFLGPVLDALEKSSADFVVSGRLPGSLRPDEIPDLYLRLDRARKLDPQLTAPPFYFNSGHLVATTGIFSPRDLEAVIEWGNPPRLRDPATFPCADQGVLNYFLPQQARRGRINLDSIVFSLWPDTAEVRGLAFAETLARGGIPFLVHWAGLRRPRLRAMIRPDIIRFFEDEYYRGVAGGRILKNLRAAGSIWTNCRIDGAVRAKTWISTRLGLKRSKLTQLKQRLGLSKG